MLYTVYSVVSGDAIAQGLTAVEAMQEILGYDGHDYEIRRQDHGYQLFVSRGSRNSVAGLGLMTECWANNNLVCSSLEGEAAATEEIASLVLAAEWLGHDGNLDVMESEEFNRITNA